VGRPAWERQHGRAPCNKPKRSKGDESQAIMIHILDARPLVAAFRRPQNNDPFTRWAAKIIRSLPYPLFTCDAVLTEAAHFLGSPARLLEAIERGLLVSRFDTQATAPRLAELIKKYADLPMDFADACLVCMSEQTKDSKIITVDRKDFSVYRRFGREPIPLLAPD
jgi:predicted nucleic acid-binding protein